MKEEISYSYDGSFAGLLCCVFESYASKEIPAAIYSAASGQSSLWLTKNIVTDTQQAERVVASIPQKMGAWALPFVRKAFLTCLPEKELQILFFLRKGYHFGKEIGNMLTDDTVATLVKAVKALENESHLLKGFIRFAERNQVLTATIGPKNCVLPLLKAHFCERYPEEKIFIYDETHKLALAYRPYQAAIFPLESLEFAAVRDEELKFQTLWKIFHQTIAIEERYNPRCQTNLLPKRYRSYMTEFSADAAANHAPDSLAPRKTEIMAGESAGEAFK